MQKKTASRVRCITLPGEIDKLVEEARKKLGMGRSQFIRYVLLVGMKHVPEL